MPAETSLIKSKLLIDLITFLIITLFIIFSEANASTTIFLLHKFCPVDKWPQNRREDQNYMMYTVECPVETLKYYDRKFLTNTFFNSSATYRLDSDVYMPHDALTKITPKTPKEYIWDQKEVKTRYIRHKIFKIKGSGKS